MSVAWVAVGATALGTAASVSASSKASKAQAKSAEAASDAQLTASRESNALQRDMYDQNRTDSEPWRQSGAAANNQLAGLMGLPGYGGDGSLQKKFGMADFTADPGYQFRLDEGNRGIERSAAARGGQLSGATMKALARFGQGTASDEYGNAYNRFNNDQSTQYNRLAGISGTGQTQVNALGQAGQNYANQVGNNTINTGNQIASNTIGAGNARAGSYMNTGNSINNAINTGYNAWNQNQYLNNNNMGSNNLAGTGYTTPDYSFSGASLGNAY